MHTGLGIELTGRNLLATSITLLSRFQKVARATAGFGHRSVLEVDECERHRIETVLLCGQSINRELQALVGVLLRLRPAPVL